ncbi:OTU domain-containing protein [Citrobacter braakii]|uniref:hypothetical protein n=1 Tax=Citrobacter braakii TaxID=57706 RepID=UPI0019059C07|nr:hypothetical protein [Citrobacter braakii]MBJ9237661.1 hypothetical protein [Citrobacter braakii]
MIPSQVANSSSNNAIYTNAKNTPQPIINELKDNNKKAFKSILPVTQNVIPRDGDKGKLLQGLSRLVSPLKISTYSISSLFRHNGSISEVRISPPVLPKPSSLAMFAFANQKRTVSEGKIAPPVPPKPTAVAMAAFANQKRAISEGKIAPPVPPKPTAVAMAAFANQKRAVFDRKPALPESLKSSALAMPTFNKTAEILSVGLKNKIIKDLNLDNWMGLGGEIAPLVMIDFYKKQNIELIIHANIKKDAIKTDLIKNNSINLINVGDHYMVLTVNKRGNIELIDVPGDGDCLFHAAVKGQKIAKTPTVNYSNLLIGNHNDEYVILKESIKIHFQNHFDAFIEDLKMILTTEKSKVANNILHDINTYIKLINI